jgi:hypothetical protein
MTQIATNSSAQSAGQYDDTSGYIKLLPLLDADGTSYLKRVHSFFAYTTTESDLLQNNIPLGQNFFYTVHQYSLTGVNYEIEALEKGIGELKKIGDDYFLVRENTFEEFTKTDGLTDSLYGTGFLIFDSSKYVCVSSYIPTNYIQLCASADSVICTTEPYNPVPIELAENAVLGRTNGQIESLDHTKIHQILGYESPLKNVSDANEPILLNTERLEVLGGDSHIGCRQLQLRTRNTRPETKAKGYLIFNEAKRAFEGYDGSEWRQLQWFEGSQQMRSEEVVETATTITTTTTTTVAPALGIRILTPGAAVYGTVSDVATITVEITGEGYNHWHWSLDSPVVGGDTPPDSEKMVTEGTGPETITGITEGVHTIYVALVDSYHNLVSPYVTDSHSFVIGGDPIAITTTTAAPTTTTTTSAPTTTTTTTAAPAPPVAYVNTLPRYFWDGSSWKPLR